MNDCPLSEACGPFGYEPHDPMNKEPYVKQMEQMNSESSGVFLTNIGGYSSFHPPGPCEHLQDLKKRLETLKTSTFKVEKHLLFLLFRRRHFWTRFLEFSGEFLLAKFLHFYWTRCLQEIFGSDYPKV